MRILGGRDYYDTALGYGRDETLVLVRTPESKAPLHEAKDVALLQPKSHHLTFARDALRSKVVSHEGVDYMFLPTVVWFAGIRHGGIMVARHDLSFRDPYRFPEETFEKRNEPFWFWHLDRFEDFLKSIQAEIKKPRRGEEGDSINATNLRAHFEDVGTWDERDWLVGSGHSVAIYNADRHASAHATGWKFDTDGLKDRQLQKLIDPFEAFQRLSQWVGGVLPRRANATIDITDEKTMVAKHGMDEWSFRKMPQSR